MKETQYNLRNIHFLQVFRQGPYPKLFFAEFGFPPWQFPKLKKVLAKVEIVTGIKTLRAGTAGKRLGVEVGHQVLEYFFFDTRNLTVPSIAFQGENDSFSGYIILLIFFLTTKACQMEVKTWFPVVTFALTWLVYHTVVLRGHRTMQMQLLPRLKDHSVSRIVKDSSVAIVED